ncbi:MAG: DNA helicase RecQ [Treponema sp.]|jgi:ATP-dependent DNA helicase RecQ|nr:DNA helicase RecQ [Treponema sp.]
MDKDKYTILKDYFGYTSFRPGQEEVIDAVLRGEDVLAVMPTGAGKSLCYQIPALMLPGLTVVVSPLISLMKDQVEGLVDSGVPAAFLNSSQTPAEYNRTMALLLQGELKLLYMAPERLGKGDAARISGSAGIPLVVVDEAHCVSQWGHDFRPGYLDIAEFIGAVSPRPVTAAFTATATPKVRQDIVRLLGLGAADPEAENSQRRDLFSITTGFDRPNLYFEVQKPQDKKEALLNCLKTRKDKSGIIYCATRKAVEEVYELLIRRGFEATRYHAGLDDDERRRNQDDFLYERKNIIVGTNAFGMGIDKSNVSFVIHYNMPKNIESYYQEAGRAGRDGAPADCILLYSGQDVRINEYLITHRDEDDGGSLQGLTEHNRELLRQMTYYATGSDCLRRRFLEYFGENPPDYCGNCSNCLTKYEETDISLEARKIISCVFRLKQRGRSFGKTMIIDILRGGTSEKIKSSGFDTLSTWGIMAGEKVHRIRTIMDYLIAEDYLFQTSGEYPVVEMGKRAAEFLKAKGPLLMMLPKETLPGPAGTGAGPEGTSAAGEAADTFDEALFTRLKGLRKRLALEAGVPAYIVFSDASLRDMCRKKPVHPGAFSAVSGVGAVKLEKYGPPFMELISEYIKDFA